MTPIRMLDETLEKRMKTDTKIAAVRNYRFVSLFALGLVLSFATSVRADEPYARSRDYDLQNVKTHLWLVAGQRSFRGETTQSLALLRDNVTELQFDSVDLKIESVALDGKAAKFATTADKLIVSLQHPGKRGDKHEVDIRYGGAPKKGLYFVMPDKNYPNRPNEVWSQGEAEDTRYYIPIYDYPNDRTTSEMILTVPGNWVTVSNGTLVGTKSESDGTKTWDWKQTEPLSTYLISAVAGEFVEKKVTWHGIPVRYIVPRGQESKIDSTFDDTRQMLETFSSKLGVPYPWAQYAQSSVDDFVEGGMENTSATTLTSGGLVHPALLAEDRTRSDDLNSHELAHQWFGDLVTCKDWSNLWLNEGFATYFEHFWLEQHYGADEADYAFWRDQSRWFHESNLYPVPLMNRNFSDSIEYAGNIYTKGGWVLRMLRAQLGDDDFFSGLHGYLETYRNQNVESSDLSKAIEQATSRNVDLFFHQWVYRAGAPEFEIHYTYDDSAHAVELTVKQTQKVEGLVGLFDLPVQVEIATASGAKTYPIHVSNASETFSLPVSGPPRMVLFDKGDNILKSVKFSKDPVELMYQLKNAKTVPDRADAAVALGSVNDNPEVVSALGEAALHDPFWGVRNESLRALGKIRTPAAEKEIIAALANDKPWVREVAVGELGVFKEDPSLGAKLADISADDPAYGVRASALRSLAEIHAPNAYDVLTAAVKTDSPDDVVRKGALRAFGALGDDRAVPLLLEWSATGKPFETRQAAISGISQLDRSNHAITQALISYLREPYFDVRFAALFALGRRGDPAAIGPLEELLKSQDLSLGFSPYIEMQIDALKNQGKEQSPPASGAASPEPTAAAQDVVLENLKKLEQEIGKINERLAKIESQLPAGKN
jgi:aminopeptidase N